MQQTPPINNEFPEGSLVMFRERVFHQARKPLLYDRLTTEVGLKSRTPNDGVYMVLGVWPEIQRKEWTGRIVFKLLDDQKVWFYLCQGAPMNILKRIDNLY